MFDITFGTGYKSWKAGKDREEHLAKLDRDIQIAKDRGL